jgi:iron complex transport system ATP-binding protein
VRSCYRALKPLGGNVWLDRSDVWALTAREYARHTAVVAQDGIAEFDFTAAEVPALGRLPHKRGFDREDEHDRELVLGALDTLGLIHLAHRPFNRMSGGERQRVLIARALVHPRVIEKVFGVTSYQVPHPITGRPYLIFERKGNTHADRPE